MTNIFKSYTNSKTNSNAIKLEKEFKINNMEFPSLTCDKDITNKDTNNKDGSFINSLKKETKENSNKLDETIPIGWTAYKYKKRSCPLLGTTNFTNKYPPYIITENKPIQNIQQINIGDKIISALCNLHEARTKKYIELWGEDEHTYMFYSPYYDYDYFNKLDEAYEIEQQKINDKYGNNENDYEYNSEYDY